MIESYCALPFDRLKIDADGSYHSCCFQDRYYGNLLKEGLTLEQAFSNALLTEVQKSVQTNDLHYTCNSTKCPHYFTREGNRQPEVSKYPKEIELALPPTWCNIGGMEPTPDTACIMCPRSSELFMSTYNDGDQTDRLLEIIKPAIPYLNTFTVLGISEPFYKGRLFEILDKLEFKTYKDKTLFWTFCNATIFGKAYQDRFIDEYMGLSCVGFSIDAATPQTYKKIRRLDFYKTVQRNVEMYFTKVNNLPTKRDWSFTTYNINEINLHEMEGMLRFSNNVGADKVQFVLTYKSYQGIAIPDSYLCNENNWQKFWDQQLRIEQIAKELNQRVEFLTPFHKGFLKQ